MWYLRSTFFIYKLTVVSITFLVKLSISQVITIFRNASFIYEWCLFVWLLKPMAMLIVSANKCWLHFDRHPELNIAIVHLVFHRIFILLKTTSVKTLYKLLKKHTPILNYKSDTDSLYVYIFNVSSESF